jgi:hypothetical protein
MEFKIFEISNWEEYVNNVKELPYREWIFRGQSNSNWPLEPKFKRIIEEIRKVKEYAGEKKHRLRYIYERDMINEFKSKSHLYIKDNPDMLFSKLDETSVDLEWLSIMQHFGAPTRLLDFSFSPFVASFFALIDANENSTVYALNREIIERNNLERISTKKYYKTLFDTRKDSEYIYPYEPVMKNERLSNQQGLFIVPSSPFNTVDEIVREYKNLSGRIPCRKYVLNKKMIYSSLKMLKKMNITHESLFSDLSGFCYSLKLLFLEKNNDRIG